MQRKGGTHEKTIPFGGGVWSIERAGGAADVMTMRDYRIIFGLERKTGGTLGSRLEVGYIFGRTVEYKSGTPDFNPDPTVMLRLGVNY